MFREAPVGVVKLGAPVDIVKPEVYISEMQEADTLGIIRHHRRVTAKGQRARLEADGCRAILDIGKGGKAKREDAERMTRPGTVVKLVHTFLLADPNALRKAGGRRKDLLDAMAKLEKRGGTIKDVDSGLTTANMDHRYALIALATEQLARDGKGLRSAMNGRLGRPIKNFPPEVWARAQMIWESRKLKTWADTREPLKELGMTPRDAWRKFGQRT